MQTFLPYPCFYESAKALDTKRLIKQRVEVYQILRACWRMGKGWHNHPAVRMWRGYERGLVRYGLEICEECKSRGVRDNTNLYARIRKFNEDGQRYDCPIFPSAFHASHRSNLLRKDPAHYGQFNWTEPDNLPYIWPTPSPGVEEYLQWRDKYYPIPASFVEDGKRGKHSLRKWEGYLEQPRMSDFLSSSVLSCAYCQEFFDIGCKGCPLDEMGMNCLESNSPYASNSIPQMVTALDQAVEQYPSI